MNTNNIEQFIQFLNESLTNKSFVRLAFMNKRIKTNDLNTVSVKLILIKEGIRLSFVYRYPTKDITKNYTIEEAGTIIENLFLTDFFQAELYTLDTDFFLSINKNNIVSIKQKASIQKEIPQLSHDHEKGRMITGFNNIYLRELGITAADWKVKTSMQDKYRQINKYIEIIDGVLKTVKLQNAFNVVDMGSGKGYLTFALYDYLYHVLKKTPHVIGVEIRKELVEECMRIARLSSFTNLEFKTGTIKDADIPATDMLIALHACDTATDDAIYRGIKANAKIIICAPCCHKQLRKQLNPEDDLQFISQFGILKERQAELLTDGIRALLMEAYGYKTRVFEFISTEHTPKNVLIAGVKHKTAELPDPVILERINKIKKIHGIGFHYLEKLLEENCVNII
ncbi:MAG: SAM-dependent methyltransferase [Bacteroidetes bacterium]|nr:SAM-dependent methyltransferase [Bacteroidota bacterium]